MALRIVDSLAQRSDLRSSRCVLATQAWRKSVTGVQQGPLPFFWGVGKMA
jgi:hypothetical protein